MKKMKSIMALILAIALGAAPLAGCGTQNDKKKDAQTDSAQEGAEQTDGAQEDTARADSAISLTDAAGREVLLQSPAKKIVSGYYITTSMLIALGLEDQTVGIEAKADKRPIYKMAAPEFLELPTVGTSKDFDLEGCVSLKPDLVILPKKLTEQAEILSGMGIPALVVNPEDQKELEAAILNIAMATGADKRADELLNYYKEKLIFMEKVSGEGRKRRTEGSNKVEITPRIYIAGTSSILRAATGKMYQSTLIEMAGGENAMIDLEDKGWADISYEKLIAADPDMIIVIPEADYSKDDVLEMEELKSITAVREGQVYEMPSAFEAWDSPVPSGILGGLWLTSIVNENEYPFEDFKKDVKDFYGKFYGIEADEELITK